MLYILQWSCLELCSNATVHDEHHSFRNLALIVEPHDQNIPSRRLLSRMSICIHDVRLREWSLLRFAHVSFESACAVGAGYHHHAASGHLAKGQALHSTQRG